MVGRTVLLSFIKFKEELWASGCASTPKKAA